MTAATIYNPVYGRDVWTSLATFSADTEAAGYPAANLATSDFNAVYRATAKTCVISFTLSRAVPVGMVVIGRHNLSQGGTFRLQLYSDNAYSTLKYDSSTDTDGIGGQDIWPTVYGFTQLDFEDDNCWSWKYRTEELTGQPWDRPVWLRDTRYLIQSGKITLTNALNAANLQAGYVEISRGQQLTRGLPVGGAASGYLANSVVTQSDGGKEYGLLKQKPRAFQAVFPTLPRDEAELLKENKRYHDIVPERPFFWHPYPRDITKWARGSFFARNAELGLHQVSAPLRDAVPVSLRECL